jgi:hypothetical protein
MSDDDDKKIKPQDLQKGGRFSKGQSGNPKGRPKKAKPVEAPVFSFGELPTDRLWQEMLERPITLKTADGPKTMTWGDALLHKFYAMAANGNRLAIQWIMELKLQYEREKARRAKEISDNLQRMKIDNQAFLDAGRNNGQVSSRILPHPADITFNRETRHYELHGPFDEEELELWECEDAMRLWLMLRSAQSGKRLNSLEKQTSCPWLTLAWLIDSQMPPSYRWSIEVATNHLLDYQVLNKKQAQLEAVRLARAAQPSTELLERYHSDEKNLILVFGADVLRGVATRVEQLVSQRGA